MRKVRTLLDEYEELRESGSTSDFPNLLGSSMYRTLIDWAGSVPDAWRSYAAIGSLTDFRPSNQIVGYEAEDLLPIGEEGVYQDSRLADAAYTIQLGTYGRAFSINRNVIINDDLGYIRQHPKRMGKAAARSIATFVAQTLLEGNANTFDGIPLFHASHNNLGTGGGSAFSAANIQTAITAMKNQTVLGVYHSVTPKWLLIPPALEWSAKSILNSTLIISTGGGASVSTIGNKNVLENALGVIIDPFLTSTTRWYVIADPSEAPIIAVAFLNGKQTPDLLVEKPTFTNLAGGDDPYEFEFDTMRYKCRYDYGGATSLWWGGYRFDGA